MPFTQQQLEELEKSMAEGTLTVKYEDRLVTYRSLAEMSRLRLEIMKELGLVKNKLARHVVATDKDLC